MNKNYDMTGRGNLNKDYTPRGIRARFEDTQRDRLTGLGKMLLAKEPDEFGLLVKGLRTEFGDCA